MDQFAHRIGKGFAKSIDLSSFNAMNDEPVAL